MITLIEPGIVLPNCRHRKLATISFLHNLHTMNRPYIISFCILIFIQDNGYEWYSWYWSRVAVKSQGKVLSLVPSLECSCSNRVKVKKRDCFFYCKTKVTRWIPNKGQALHSNLYGQAVNQQWHIFDVYIFFVQYSSSEWEFRSLWLLVAYISIAKLFF